MNHRQIELVRSSYDRIRRVRPLVADLFNRRLTLIAPVLDRLLPADPAERDDAFCTVMETVVAGLDRLDVLLPSLAAQARAWRLRGVEPADYDVVGMVLVWTIEQVLAGSPNAVAAWRETYELLAGVMKRVAADPDAARPPGPRRPPSFGRAPRSERTPPRSYRVPPVSERSPQGRSTLPSR